ncbi:MAG: DedA family protein [Microgenomates group bacterium]|nr:DedA family protein [Microgenomates group bacterium]
MINNLINFLSQIIIFLINKTGYWGIFILMAAESALIPIPSEITMPFSGYLSSVGRFNLYLVILVGAAANLFGSILAYWLGLWGQEAVVRKLIKKYGKYILVSEHEFNRSEKWFRKYGEKIVFFSRILPVVRTFISLPAGIAAMNFWKFCGLTFIGSLIWSAFLTYIGFILGKNWHSIEIYYRRFEFLVVFCFLAAFIYFIAHKIKSIKNK